jgi:ribonuclease HIII
MQDSFQKSALNEIENIAKILTKHGYSVTSPDKKLYNYEIIVNSQKEQIKFQVYFGNKGIKKVLQGNKELKIYKELYDMLFGKNLFDDDSRGEVSFREYVGTDESGKGDYFGPLVIAAVYINDKTKNELEKIGVKDSKLIFDLNIKILESKIKKIVAGNFEIIQINPEKYNQLYESFRNLNKIMAWAHSKAIENLLLNVNCTNVISDKFGNEKLIKDELKKKKIEVNLYQTTKGERFTAVAAASILARAKVVDWFNIKSKEVGFEIPKGGGEAVTLTAKRVFNQFNDKYLLKMIKFHFKNSQSIYLK